MTRMCHTCGHEIATEEPYVTFDMVTQRYDHDDDMVCVLEGREITTHCVSCGYGQRSRVMQAALGIELVEAAGG